MPSNHHKFDANGRDQDCLSKTQLRVLANVMRQWAGGRAHFLKAIHEAERLKGRQLNGEAIWRQIAEEMSVIEIAETSKSSDL